MLSNKASLGPDYWRGFARGFESQQLSLAHAYCVCWKLSARECGIATFTTDLCTALTTEYGEGRLFAIPVNEPDCKYNYPEQVRLEIAQEEISSYERAADFLNFNGNDLVCLQHEYGIYGGRAGCYILALLRKLKMPLVTTLHTVLREPDASQRAVLDEIAQLSIVSL